MKIKLLVSLCLVLSISFASFSQSAKKVESSSNAVETPEIQKISWDSQEYDFGAIPQNLSAEAEFVFTNISDEPVIISKVKSSCGCTVTGYDKKPVLPGESSTIMATYNAKKLGAFRKTLRVTTNDFKPYKLTIKGEVEAEQEVIGMK